MARKPRINYTETDKAVMEVEAPEAGVLVDVFFAVDDDVPVLETIAAIGEAGEDVSALRPSGGAAAPAAEEAAPAAAEDWIKLRRVSELDIAVFLLPCVRCSSFN